MIRERAPAKVNLLLHVGPTRADGRHEICSLFASIDLADEVEVEAQPESAGDEVSCPGVSGPNLASAAIAAYRAEAPDLPALRVSIEKRIPVAGGLGGGSADAAAVLRAADALLDGRLGFERLRAIGGRLGADVPSQVEPAHAVVTGAGEILEPVALPRLSVVLLPDPTGLSTAEVYGEADRIGCTRASLDSGLVRDLASAPLATLLAALENDLEPAARSLRPVLARPVAALRDQGALAALLTGSGPTAFGVFEGRDEAERVATALPAAIACELVHRAVTRVPA